MNRVTNAYRVLQVDRSADFIVIQAAYRALARRYHPDGDAPDIDRMTELNRAFEILRDPGQRRRHDDLLAASSAPTAIPVQPPPATRPPWSSSRTETGDRAVLDFGRYMGWRIADLARHDPDYLRWLMRHSSGLRFRSAIARVLPPDANQHGRTGVA